MDNPFKKRATEYFEDPSSLISVLSPEPLKRFFAGNSESYLDRLVTIVGTPGSGKTSIARLVEFDTIIALLSSQQTRDFKELGQALRECQILVKSLPQILACRLPTTSDMRNIWELPYSLKIRKALLCSLIQARSVLGWLRKLESAEVDLALVKINIRPQYEVQSRLIQASNVLEFREHARLVEEKIFRIITALVPPNEADLAKLGPETTYEAFQLIETITVAAIPNVTDSAVVLRPLCILDDAHELHPEQYVEVESWLKGRELKVARWLMTRVDAINPETLRKALQENDSTSFGSTKDRDWILRLMQRGSSERRAYRATVKDIAKRYIDQMPLLRRRVQFESCLDAIAPKLTSSDQKELEKSVASAKAESGFSKERLAQIESWIPNGLSAEERLALTRVLVYREIKRTPQGDLFATESQGPEELPDARSVSAQLVTGANLQLLHQFERPFYYSFDRLADASGENIEQFIHLAGVLVEQIETKVIRGKDPKLDAKSQHLALVNTAKDAIDNWNYPYSTEVRRLVKFIASKCITRTLETNAPLDDGANAFGILQSEMDKFQKEGGRLVLVLHNALAYNAITLTEGYECKKKTWCLFQLGGLPILANGLTFSRGGFCEGTLGQLISSIEE